MENERPQPPFLNLAPFSAALAAIWFGVSLQSVEFDV